jgi:transposase
MVDAENGAPTKSCPYCRETMHRDAWACPHCTRAFPIAEKSTSFGTALVLLIAIAVVGALALLPFILSASR